MSKTIFEMTEIIKVTILDINKLVSISKKTFEETFGSQNSKDNLEKYY